MLVLSRKKGESLIIGGDITITVLEVQSDKIKIGIDAPKEVTILRKELYENVTLENIAASNITLDQALEVESLLKKNQADK